MTVRVQARRRRQEAGRTRGWHYREIKMNPNTHDVAESGVNKPADHIPKAQRKILSHLHECRHTLCKTYWIKFLVVSTQLASICKHTRKQQLDCAVCLRHPIHNLLLSNHPPQTLPHPSWHLLQGSGPCRQSHFTDPIDQVETGSC